MSKDTSEQLIHPKYRADIDGLRGIAVLAVVLYHAFPAWIKGGFIGVDIFFVISGFLISKIIIGNLEEDRFSFLEFYGRRIKRIFPALLIVLFSVFVMGWILLLPIEYKQLGKHLAGGVSFISNFIFWNEIGYFDNASETKPLLHLWSLSVEEQFYIIWPFLLWGAWKKKINLMALTIIIMLGSFLLNIYQISNDITAAFFSPFTRFWEILVGSTLACIGLNKQIFKYPIFSFLDNSKVKSILSVIGAACLLTGVMLINRHRLFPGWWALLPTFGTVLIISAGPQSWFNNRILTNRLLVWFGLISFPLYLWHWPLLSLIQIIEESIPARLLRVAVIFISIFISWFTYKFVEKPIRFGENSKLKTKLLLAMMFMLGLVGFICYTQNGLEYRFKNEFDIVMQFRDKANEELHNQNCDNLFPIFKDFDACLLSKPLAPSIAIIGDSHANHYYRSLSKILPNESVLNIGQWSCLPFVTKNLLTKDKCIDKINITSDFLLKLDSLKTIYLAGYWSYLAAGSWENEKFGWRIPLKNPPALELLSFQQNAESVISKLILSKKNIVLLLDIPDMTFDVKSCFNFRPLRITKKTLLNPCAIKRDDYEKRIALYTIDMNELLKKFPTIKVFDPKSIFCDEKYCWAVKNSQALYYNSDHLLPIGADLVIRELFNKYPIQ